MMKTIVCTSLLVCLLFAIGTESRRKFRDGPLNRGRARTRQTGYPCPPHQQLYHCYIDPCMFARCDEPAGTECRSNYCNGCNAEFYLNDEKVECTRAGNPRWNLFGQNAQL